MPSAWDMDGRWKGIHTHYACGETNSTDKSLVCKQSPNTAMRHNSVRDFEAHIVTAVWRDVQIERALLPINENDFERKVNTANNARLDISARGLWNSCEKTFFNRRITHQTSLSYSNKPLSLFYQQREKEKANYNQRVIAIEKSSFNPLHSNIRSQVLHRWLPANKAVVFYYLTKPWLCRIPCYMLLYCTEVLSFNSGLSVEKYQHQLLALKNNNINISPKKPYQLRST